jgi:hypothetical protein
MGYTVEPTANQRRVLEALKDHEHLVVLLEGNGVVPHLWVGSADIAALKKAGWIVQTADLGSTSMWEITSSGRAVLGKDNK